MPQGRPLPEPTPEEIQGMIEHLQTELRALVDGDMSNIEDDMHGLDEIKSAYESLSDYSKEIVRWQSILTNALFIVALLKREAPYEVAGVLAAELLHGEMAIAELLTRIHAENN